MLVLYVFSVELEELLYMQLCCFMVSFALQMCEEHELVWTDGVAPGALFGGRLRERHASVKA